jgi:hypothetical protein
VTPRRKLTPAQRAELWRRQEGKCGCGCGEPLTGDTRIDQDEHENCRWVSGDDSLANRRLMLKHHHAVKTKTDRKIIAKVKRQAAKHRGERKNITRNIPSRGFDKRHQPLRRERRDNTKYLDGGAS